MKKTDLKKLALMGMAGGLLMSANSLSADSLTEQQREQGTLLAGHACGGKGCSSYRGGGSSCGGIADTYDPSGAEQTPWQQSCSGRGAPQSGYNYQPQQACNGYAQPYQHSCNGQAYQHSCNGQAYQHGCHGNNTAAPQHSCGGGHCGSPSKPNNNNSNNNSNNNKPAKSNNPPTAYNYRGQGGTTNGFLADAESQTAEPSEQSAKKSMKETESTKQQMNEKRNNALKSK